MKKQLITLIAMLLPMLASADAVEIDGIYYNLVTKAGQAEVTSNPNQYEEEVVIPKSVTYDNVDYSVTSIGDGAFDGCSGLTSITIPNSVTSIGKGAFSGCSSLISITIPNSVTSIGKKVFHGCSGLTSITIPSSVTSIGDGAFDGCSGLTSITIPNSVTSIGERTFCECSGLTSITIPNSVTSIGQGAFSGCSSLTSITIPNSVTFIGYDAFEDCRSLTSVYISDLESWCKIIFDSYGSNPLRSAQHLFLKGEEINDLVIPNGVISIGQYAFFGYSGLTSVTIGNSVTSIGASAFYYCSGLTSVTIGEGVTSIGDGAFSYCSSLTSITIPNSVTSIGGYAFSWCIGLTDISLPEKLKIIKKQTFYQCELKSITIPATVEYIYPEAFSGCSLKEVKALPETPPFLYDNSFSNYNITLKVPETSKEAYMTTSPWSKFTTFQTLTGDDLEKKKCEKPTISLENGQLTFACATGDVTYKYNISGPNATGEGNNIKLTPEITITVYATKSGYENSEVATLKLTALNSVIGPDLNGDGEVDAADVVKLVNSIVEE